MKNKGNTPWSVYFLVLDRSRPIKYVFDLQFVMRLLWRVVLNISNKQIQYSVRTYSSTFLKKACWASIIAICNNTFHLFSRHRNVSSVIDCGLQTQSTKPVLRQVPQRSRNHGQFGHFHPGRHLPVEPSHWYWYCDPLYRVPTRFPIFISEMRSGSAARSSLAAIPALYQLPLSPYDRHWPAEASTVHCCRAGDANSVLQGRFGGTGAVAFKGNHGGKHGEWVQTATGRGTARASRTLDGSKTFSLFAATGRGSRPASTRAGAGENLA